MKILLRLCICVILVNFSALPLHAERRAEENERLYNTLDSLLDKQQSIVRDKEERINVIREGLFKRNLSREELIQINHRLYDEYIAFRFDSAHHYIQQNIKLLSEMGDTDRLVENQLELSHILSVTGLFDKSRQVLDLVRKEPLSPVNKIAFYNAMSEFFLFQTELAFSTPYYHEYLDSLNYYRDLLKDMAWEDPYTKRFNEAVMLCQNCHEDEAIDILNDMLKNEKNPRKYSVATSTLAYFCRHKGDSIGAESYLIRSAISDVRNAIRENNSLRELAQLLMEKGESKRAFRYLNASIEDASFYGTPLRNMQAAQLVPQITNAYAEARRQILYGVLVAFAVMSLLTLLLVVFRVQRSRAHKELAVSNQKLTEANDLLTNANDQLTSLNDELVKVNDRLRESGCIKDEYIGQFFEMGSGFVVMADERNKKLSRLARDHKLDELFKELKSNQFFSDISNEYFSRFDEAFYRIYPTFVDELNQLLETKSQMVSHGKTLSTELRILALIRLGINNNQKIADILHTSITTVYTYRSKMKAKAIVKDTFESDIEMLGNIK